MQDIEQLTNDICDIISRLRNKYADKKLANAFRSLEDLFEQIFEAIHNPASEHAKLGVSNVDFILGRVEQFKDELKERKILRAYEGIEYEIGLLKYSLQKLQAYLDNLDETHINGKAAYTYIAKEQAEELLEWAKGVDEEYSQDDPENHSS